MSEQGESGDSIAATEPTEQAPASGEVPPDTNDAETPERPRAGSPTKTAAPLAAGQTKEPPPDLRKSSTGSGAPLTTPQKPSRAGSEVQNRAQSRKKTARPKGNPPKLSPEQLRQLECGYVLDGVALSSRANAEPHRTNPSLNIGVKQYNAQADKHCQSYFRARGVQKTLAKTKQDSGGTSMCSEVFDRLVESSEAKRELDIRNEQGAGYCYEETVCGHSLPVSRPFSGYNGPNGYRRNTPDLRRNPSPFGFPGRPVYVKATERVNSGLYKDLESS